MPSSLRHPKTIADWLELDSFRRPRLLHRFWWWAVVVAFLGSIAWSAWAVWASNQKVFQAGPVSTAHSMLACAQCHTHPFQTAVRFLHQDSDSRSVPDSACQQCHSGAVHHATAVGERRCVSCHREHHGRAALVRMDNRHCTSCHDNLQRNDGKTSEFETHIRAFTEGKHPDYRLFRDGEPKDQGGIRFNHKVHLAPEGVLEKDLSKQKQPQHRRVLECQDCHQPDAAGRYLLPIRYEQHCQKCHPISVQLAGDWTEGPLRDRARRFSEKPIAHPSPGKTPAEVRGSLHERLTRFIQAPENKGFLKAAPPPLRLDLGPRHSEPLSKEQYAWVNAQQAELERMLFDGAGGCRYCHTQKGTAPDGLPEYRPSNIKERWHQHDEFKHHSHRLLQCTECHKATDSTQTADVLLPRIDTCFACHDADKDRARSSCLECHKYHNQTEQRKFRGSRTIQQALER
jgi:hypothetical protein